MMKHMKIGLAVATAVCSIFLASQAGAQALQSWVINTNGTGNSTDVGVAVKTDPQGNVYVTGTSIGNGTGADILTEKYSPNGHKLWARRYNGSSNAADYPAAMVVDSSSNVYVTGRATMSANGVNYVTVKYDINGVQQWVKTYNASGGEDHAHAIALASDGSVYVTGSAGGGATCTTIRYEANGTQTWVRQYSTPNNSGVNIGSAVVVKDGSVYVTGSTYNGNNGDDGLILKLNGVTGAVVWVRTFNGPYGQESNLSFGTYPEDGGSDIAIDANSNILVTGWVTTHIAAGDFDDYGVTDLIVLKYNSAGTLQWTKQLGGIDTNEDGRKIVTASGGDVYVTGAGGTAKLNSAGNILWTKNLHGSDVDLDPLGNVYVMRTAQNATYDYHIDKYDSTGVFKWSATYNSPAGLADHPYDLHIDTAGNVYITGKSMSNNGGLDNFATVRYVQEPYVQLNLTHTYWGDIQIEVGVGNPQNPLWSKKIRSNEGTSSSGQLYNFCTIMDAPLFYQRPSESVVWYCKVSDTLSGDSGTVQTFRVVNGSVFYTSGNMPQTLPDMSSVLAYVPTRTQHHALIDIDHTFRGDLQVTVGVGDPNNPLWSKAISNYTGGALDNMWCQVDLTAAAVHFPPSINMPWFLKVHDGASADTGSIQMFRLTDGGNTWISFCMPRPINDFQTTQVFVPKLQGDVNCDGCVDDEDLLLVLFAFGTTGLNIPEDLNGDYSVDDNDLLLVLFSFGQGC